ncbi:MAG: GTP-binding protein, partial [Oscillospiraceae bacterium]|nr:GTP-binding protein [Oscillospiraceae bacterium]
AAVITTPWDELEGKTILKAIEGVPMHDELLELVKEAHEHQHEHELEDEEEEHEHHHHHDHELEDEEEEHEHHHHHDHDEDDDHDHHHEDEDDDHDHGHHHHDHDHGPDCACGCHDHEGHEHHHHHHHHHGDADETFQSWGKESPKPFSRSDVEKILDALDSGEYGTVLRAKGIVPDGEGGWLEFDFVPGERELRGSEADYTGRLCVIGSGLKEEKLSELFGL